MAVLSDFIESFNTLSSTAVTYIIVTRNTNEMPILNSNSFVRYLTQINEDKKINIIYLHDLLLSRF